MLVPARKTNVGAQKCVIQRVKKSAVVVLDKSVGLKRNASALTYSRVWSSNMITITSPRRRSTELIRDRAVLSSFINFCEVLGEQFAAVSELNSYVYLKWLFCIVRPQSVADAHSQSDWQIPLTLLPIIKFGESLANARIMLSFYFADASRPPIKLKIFFSCSVPSGILG